jgi:hypothetical protein
MLEDVSLRIRLVALCATALDASLFAIAVY